MAWYWVVIHGFDPQSIYLVCFYFLIADNLYISTNNLHICARLPGWKGKLLSTSGRETLVKTVLSSQPIYHMTAFLELKWLIHKIVHFRMSFLWRGDTPDKVYGGHSLVNWATACRPKEKGGLGILDLERFIRALRLRWLWFKWKHKE